jgi:hypothetical protein
MGGSSCPMMIQLTYECHWYWTSPVSATIPATVALSRYGINLDVHDYNVDHWLKHAGFVSFEHASNKIVIPTWQANLSDWNWVSSIITCRLTSYHGAPHAPIQLITCNSFYIQLSGVTIQHLSIQTDPVFQVHFDWNWDWDHMIQLT